MLLKTEQLRAFLQVSSGIQKNTILPILSYLKFKDGQIVKSNMECFVVMDADFEGEFLIDEIILSSVVGVTNEPLIEIEKNGVSLLIKYGNKTIISPTEGVSGFPEISPIQGVDVYLGNNILRSIKTAALFTEARDNMPFTSSVFVGAGVIAACSGFIGYVEKVTDIELPEIVIDKTAISVIKNFDNCIFSENGAYQFYRNGAFRFGFIKKDTKFVNMNNFMTLPDIEPVIVNKNEIIPFCDICCSVTQGRPVVANCKDGLLWMKDGAYGIDLNNPLSTTLSEFAFNPAHMSKLLKAIPDENVNFYKGVRKYSMNGSGNWVSLIMELTN